MSCFGGREELIYLAEMTVERLRLTENKYSEDFAKEPPLIKIKFLDFPVLEITPRADFLTSLPPPGQYDENEGLTYACGKTILFVRKPRDLVSAMKTKPLNVGVFRKNDIFAIAEAKIPLGGCLCDQITMVGNDPEHRPKPFELVGGFNVLDSGQDYAGAINIFFRLTYFGPYVISDYQIYEDSCVFKNNFDGNLRLTKVEDVPDENEEDETRKQFKIDKGTVFAAMRKCKKKLK